MTTWCATGHRPEKLGRYGSLTSIKLYDFARRYLETYRPDRFISGMALGWDTACARACVSLGIPFIAAIPFVGQESQWPESSRRIYADLLACAERIETVSLGGFNAKAMQRRNEWMVDLADGVLALWDGSSGGTCNCVKYAQRVGKPMTNLWDYWTASCA